MLCGKPSYIIARIFVYNSFKKQLLTQKTSLIIYGFFYLKEGNILWLTASKTQLKNLAMLIVVLMFYEMLP